MRKWSSNTDNTCFTGLDILCMPTATSTNDIAKERIKSAAGNTLTVAETQTAGRGRMGRTFHSPDKTGAYFTLTLRGEWDVKDALKFTSLAAVCVCRAIEELTDLSPKIKWVNDIYIGDKKVCGILCETSLSAQGKVADVILGIGINLTTEIFPSDIPNAGSLNIKELQRAEIIALTCLGILKETPFITQNKHFEYYKSHSLALDKPVYFIENGIRYDGIVTKITKDYGLSVTLENGQIKTLSSGEITLRIKN